MGKKRQWVVLRISKQQAFDIWKQLKAYKTSEFPTLMAKLYDIFGGSKSKNYKQWMEKIKEDC